MAARALITGATGLIGTHLIEQWSDPDIEPVIVDHRSDNLLEPGTPARLVNHVQPSVVIHLAWSASGTLGYRTSNLNDQWLNASNELAEACQQTGARLIATGTILDRVLREGDAYATAKYRLHESLKTKIADGQVTWVRPYYVFDPARKRPEVVAHAMAALSTGAAVSLRSPESAHDFIHAADVAKAILVVAQHELRDVIPIGSGTSRKVRELVAALGVEWRAEPSSAPEIHDHEVADTTILRMHDWTPSATDLVFHSS
jgi:nucleoside-diphosphate-sugar epimerase